MGIMGYENTRAHFEGIVRLYKGYLQLYKEISGGSIEGCTPFHEFYWRMTYFSKYSDRRNWGQAGY